MSLAQLLGHLKTGDLIIVRSGGNAAMPLRPQTIVAGTQSGAPHKSHRLLRSLIAVRRAGAKKK